jgi:hypothetical protein
MPKASLKAIGTKIAAIRSAQRAELQLKLFPGLAFPTLKMTLKAKIELRRRAATRVPDCCRRGVRGLWLSGVRSERQHAYDDSGRPRSLRRSCRRAHPSEFQI